MKKIKLILLIAMLAIVGSSQAEYINQEYVIHYIITLPHKGDSTALYQRVATGNPNEPYTTGAIVRWLHYPFAWYPNEPEEVIAEREFGIYEKGKDLFVTVTIDGQQYFISAYALSRNDNSGTDWVYESLPNHDSGIPWGKILLFGIGGIVLLAVLFGSKGSSRSTSSSYSGGDYSQNREDERRKQEREEAARKKKEEEARRHERWYQAHKND